MPAAPESATLVTAAAPKTVISTVLSSNAVSEPAPVPAAPPARPLTEEQRQGVVDAEVERLQQLSMKDDPASLSNILADLTNPEKEVRDAAIEAAKEFGSSNAIPTLKAVAMNTADTEEQIALLEAASFLAVPEMDFNTPAPVRTPEQIQARNERDARRRSKMQQGLPNSESQSPNQGQSANQ